MKTTFRRRYSVGASYGRRFVYVGLALILGVLLIVVLRSEVIALAKPLWLADNAVSRSLGNMAGYFRSKGSLIRENMALKEAAAGHELLAASYRALESSREELLMSFGRSESVPGIPAGVLAHPPETPYDMLVIDAGARDGVEAGDSVSAPQGGALGLVSEVFDGAAKVALYSGSGIETPAYLERGSVRITLRGLGGGAFEFSLPRDVAVEVGDRILLPGLGAELVAVVREVYLEPTDSVKTVMAGGLGNVASIRFVTVR